MVILNELRAWNRMGGKVLPGIGRAVLLCLVGFGLWGGALGEARRVVSTAPSITEMLFALGAGEEVVGVTSYCQFPEEARRKPIIGDFANPNVESVLMQRPDLVVLLSGRQDLVDKFRPFSLQTLVLRHETLADILGSISVLGDAVGRRDEARELVARIGREMETIERRVADLERKRVLFLIGRNTGSLTDLYAVGNTSYIGQLIQRAGGINIFGGESAVYPKVSIEQVLAQNPEVIIDHSHGEEITAAEIEQVQRLWSSFPKIEAVARKKVHVLSTDVFLVPGPRLPEAIRLLVDVIHGKGLD